eukprot:IDg2814t1
MTRPDLLCFTARFSQITKTKHSARVIRRFNQFVSYCHENESVPLRYVPLDLDSAHVAVFTDASFSTSEEPTSQLGVVVLLRDSSGRCNIIHASSIKAKRRARSVLGAEMFALLDGFDSGYVIRALLSKIIGRKVALHLLTDSRSAYHIATTLIQTKEKRLMLDVHLLREAYERREITKITWIAGQSNIADCLTKIKHNGSLLTLQKTNQCYITIEGWVDRDLVPVHALSRRKEEVTTQKEMQQCIDRLHNGDRIEVSKN